jgi:hypothetical protein
MFRSRSRMILDSEARDSKFETASNELNCLKQVVQHPNVHPSTFLSRSGNRAAHAPA